jgi:hypothetical protein
MATIDTSAFGSVTIDEKKYDSDVYVLVSGKVEEREKSHTISKKEIEYILKDSPEMIVIGRGTSAVAELNDEAQRFVETLDIDVVIGKTPDIRTAFNGAKGKVGAIIHTTC